MIQLEGYRQGVKMEIQQSMKQGKDDLQAGIYRKVSRFPMLLCTFIPVSSRTKAPHGIREESPSSTF